MLCGDVKKIEELIYDVYCPILRRKPEDNTHY